MVVPKKTKTIFNFLLSWLFVIGTIWRDLCVMEKGLPETKKRKLILFESVSIKKFEESTL